MKLVVFKNKEKVVPATLLKAEKRKKRVHKGEDKDAFISRKMSEMKEEFPDQAQRYAVALSMWEKERGNSDVAKSLFLKAKYISRKKGKNGKWVYTYTKNKHQRATSVSSDDDLDEKWNKKVETARKILIQSGSDKETLSRYLDDPDEDEIDMIIKRGVTSRKDST
jgi:hypothetical protein